MDQNTQEALAEFRNALEASGAGLPEYLYLVSSLIEAGATHMAYAILNHTRDVLDSVPTGGELPYHELIAASYSRAFCEPEHIAKYGGNPAKLSESDVPGFLRGIAAGLQQVAQSSNPEQIALALEADTGNAH